MLTCNWCWGDGEHSLDACWTGGCFALKPVEDMDSVYSLPPPSHTSLSYSSCNKSGNDTVKNKWICKWWEDVKTVEGMLNQEVLKVCRQMCIFLLLLRVLYNRGGWANHTRVKKELCTRSEEQDVAQQATTVWPHVGDVLFYSAPLPLCQLNPDNHCRSTPPLLPTPPTLIS